MDGTPKRRPRWPAVVLVGTGLFAAYPASYWPLCYLLGRDVITPGGSATGVIDAVYWPVKKAVVGPDRRPRPGLGWYLSAGEHCYVLGVRDRIEADRTEATDGAP